MEPISPEQVQEHLDSYTAIAQRLQSQIEQLRVQLERAKGCIHHCRILLGEEEALPRLLDREDEPE